MKITEFEKYIRKGEEMLDKKKKVLIGLLSTFSVAGTALAITVPFVLNDNEKNPYENLTPGQKLSDTQLTALKGTTSVQAINAAIEARYTLESSSISRDKLSLVYTNKPANPAPTPATFAAANTQPTEYNKKTFLIDMVKGKLLKFGFASFDESNDKIKEDSELVVKLTTATDGTVTGEYLQRPSLIS